MKADNLNRPVKAFKITSDMYKIQMELDLWPETRGGLRLIGCELK